MTTHDKDKIISAAKEAGFDVWVESVGPLPFWIERFYAIAFEDGRKAEREECAKILEKQDVDPAFKHRLADAIRARGEGK